MQIIDIGVVTVGRWDMTEQPLHDISDSMYSWGARLGIVFDMLNEGKLITAYNDLIAIRSEIKHNQFALREKAIREEGEKII